MPDTVLALNGAPYPQACYPLQKENHFFVIGDWGGMCGYGLANECGKPGSFDVPQPQQNGRCNDGACGGSDSYTAEQAPDHTAQQRVAATMDAVAAETPPEFVITVGDHFYPGGIIEHCDGRADSANIKGTPHQFKSTFEDIYDSPHMAGKEWMGVLGNHDYGGTCVNTGWTQQIWYTWNEVSDRWVLPAQYYSRNFRFAQNSDSGEWSEDDISVDVFFLDDNVDDGNSDYNHGICQPEGNSGVPGDHFCTEFLGEEDSKGQCAGTPLWIDAPSCETHFKTLWQEQLDWLDEELGKSTADWQMLVMHYPPYSATSTNWNGEKDVLSKVCEKHGVDFIMTGHSHHQMLIYRPGDSTPFRESENVGPPQNVDYGATAWVVSGGGGGITSEGAPRLDGNDGEYGFVDVTVTKDLLSIQMIGHGFEGSPDGQPGNGPPHKIQNGFVQIQKRLRADELPSKATMEVIA